MTTIEKLDARLRDRHARESLDLARPKREPSARTLAELPTRSEVASGNPVVLSYRFTLQDMPAPKAVPGQHEAGRIPAVRRADPAGRNLSPTEPSEVASRPPEAVTRGRLQTVEHSASGQAVSGRPEVGRPAEVVPPKAPPGLGDRSAQDRSVPAGDLGPRQTADSGATAASDGAIAPHAEAQVPARKAEVPPSEPSLPVRAEDRESAAASRGRLGDANVRTAVDPGVPIGTAPSDTRYRGYIVAGLLLLVLGIGGFLAWASLAPLKSGAMAPGTVHVEGERKTVQHLEGGIVREILVREGDKVDEGQVLIRLDGTQAKANLAAREAEYHTLLAQEGRLRAESQLADKVVFPAALLERSEDPAIEQLLAGEVALFTARKTALQDQLGILDSGEKAFADEIDGLKAGRHSAQTQLVHIRDELDAVETLYKKGLIDKPRLLALKRTAAGLEGKIGELDANVSRVLQKVNETKLRAVAARTQYLEGVSAELQKVQAGLLQIVEKLDAARDSVGRLDVLAPRSGRVVGLKAHTIGGVIPPSSPILDIVPADDRLIVLAQISPLDIDVVVPGLEAQVQLTAFSMRKVKPLPGRVLQVSADRVEDEVTGKSYYLARLEVDEAALKGLEGVHLYPGMPASVQIVTGERTPLDYLLSPLAAGLRSAWLEN